MEPTPGLGQPPEPPTVPEQLKARKKQLEKQLADTSKAIDLFELHPEIAEAFLAVRTLL